MRFLRYGTSAKWGLLVLAMGLGPCACERAPQGQTAMDPKIAKSLEDFRNRRIYRELSPNPFLRSRTRMSSKLLPTTHFKSSKANQTARGKSSMAFPPESELCS